MALLWILAGLVVLWPVLAAVSIARRRRRRPVTGRPGQERRGIKPDSEVKGPGEDPARDWGANNF